MAKRILQVFASLDVGGAETRMMEVYRNIDKSKVDFDFLTMQLKDQFYEKEILNNRGKIFKIDPPRESGIFKNILNIYKIIKENGPYDGVHAHTSYHCALVMIAAKLAKVPIRICHARTTNSKNTSYLSKLYLKIGQKIIGIFSTDELAVCKDAGLYLYGKNSIKNKKVKILPNAIDIKRFNSIPDKEISRLKLEYKIKDDFTIIGHVGRFESMKNHKFLIDLFKKYLIENEKSLLVLIGDGPLKKEIQELAKLKGIEESVLFLGIRQDVNKWMKIFDILILPSIYEGLCGVAIESQAAGTPVLISDTVTKEVDLNLGITKFLSLEEPINNWIKGINELITYDSIDENKILEKFYKKGQSIDSYIYKLNNIYGV